MKVTIKLASSILVLWAVCCLAPHARVYAQQSREPAGGGAAAARKGVEPDKQLTQQLALGLLRRLADELKSEPNKVEAALLQAEVADLLWKYDELAARAIFRLAFDAARQPVPDASATDSKSAAERTELLRRQALALREVLQRLGVHDRKTAEAWLKSFEQEQSGADSPAKPSSTVGADLLIQIALELAKTNPEQAQRLGLRALSYGEIPEDYGRLLIALGNQDRALSDVLFRAGIEAMRRNNFAYSSNLIPMSNYMFFATGKAFPDMNAADIRLFTNYLAEAVNTQATAWRAARAAGSRALQESGARTFNFLNARGMQIIKLNAPEKFRPVQILLDELSSGLNQQQLREAADLASAQRQQDAITDGFGSDQDTLLRRAEEERDPLVRDNLWRTAIISLMRSDPERALTLTTKIDDLAMRAQTQDDVNIVLLADQLRSSDDDQARRAALKLNDPILQVRALAALAERAASASSTRRADELLSEAYQIASKSENKPDKLAVMLLLAGQFGKFDEVRGFQLLSEAIKIANQLPSQPSQPPSPPRRRGPRVVTYTVVGGAELSTGENPATLNSINFQEIGVFARRDFTQTSFLAERIENKMLRAKYLLALSRGVLQSPSSVETFGKPAQ